MLLSDVCCGTPGGPTSVGVKAPFLLKHFFVTDRSHVYCWRECSQSISSQKAKHIAQMDLHAHI